MAFRPVVTAAAALAVYLAPSPLTLARSVDLAPRLERGAELHYVTRSLIHHEVHVDEANVDEKVVVRTEAGMTLRVAEVDADGSATIEWDLRYVSISTDGAMPGIEEMLDYDSRKPQAADSPLAPLFAGLLDRPVAVRVDPSGRVTDFQKPQTGGPFGPLSGLAGGFFSKQAFEQLPLFITSGAPTPARRGVKWSKTTSVDMPLGVGAIVMDQQFKLKRIDARRQTGVIEMTGTLSKKTAGTSSGSGTSSSQANNPLAVDAGSVSGEFLWDYAAGQLASGETQFELETELDTPLGRMQLEQRMSSSMKRTRVEE